MSDYSNRLADLRQLYEKLEAENTRLRQDLEANTNAFVSLQRDAEATTRQVQALSDDRAMLQGQLQMSRDHVKELKATLDRLTKDLISLKVKLHLKGGTVSEDDFTNCTTEYSADKQTATEAAGLLDYQRRIDQLLTREVKLIAELKQVRVYNKKLEFDLRHAELAYNRLKGLRHAANYCMSGQQLQQNLHPINQPRALPPWSVDFPTKDHGTITILFYNSPSVTRLDDLQERLEATGWTLTYNGFKQ